ncbi:MAG TPA: ABC transporter ATP-binding protein [Ktedonobacteraceae bacterium]|nr:ABC transporter ATP-binding protein [Ktedonobacteraceae bacterium]
MSQNERQRTPGPGSKQVSSKQYLAILRTYLAPQIHKVVLTAIFLLACITLRLAGPQILRLFIDTALAGAPMQQVSTIALIFLGMALSTQLITGLATYLCEDVGWTATNQLRSDLSLHCLSLDPGFHKVHTPGELIERVDSDILALAGFFAQFVMRVLGNGLLMISILVLIFLEDIRLGLILVIGIICMVLAMQFVQKLAIPFLKNARQASANLSGFWGDHFLGLEDIAALNAGPYVLRRYFQFQRLLNRANVKGQVMSRAVEGTRQVITTITLALGLTLSSFFLSNGSMTIGTAFLVFTYMVQLSDNLSDISAQVDTLQQVITSFERITELYATPSQILDGPGVQFPEGALEVAFADVSFGYDQETTTLSEISFKLAPGEILGILGRTGSGKTTLARLLLRFYDPRSGVISLGEQDIRSARLKDLRQHIGFVTQEVQFFQATVRDNLTFFDRSITDAQLLQTAEQLGLSDWLCALPQGLDTQLVSGKGFSAGEAQLLAFTRVFLKDPGLVLFDEASSRLDPASERLVIQAMGRLLDERTGIIITHHFSTLELADKIMILENGRIAEFGRRDALMQSPSSTYATLLRTAKGEKVLP